MSLELFLIFGLLIYILCAFRELSKLHDMISFNEMHIRSLERKVEELNERIYSK